MLKYLKALTHVLLREMFNACATEIKRNSIIFTKNREFQMIEEHKFC